MHIDFHRIVEKLFSNYNPKCVKQFKKALEDISSSIETTRGANKIQQKLK